MDGKTNEIHGLMVKVMRSIGFIGKDKNAPYGEKFAYRGIDDVINAVGDAVREHGVVVEAHTSNEVISRHVIKGKHGEREVFMVQLRINVTFSAPDGSGVSMSGFGMGIDDSDKATGKAMSNAYKEALFKGLVIPTAPGEQPDVEAYDPANEKPTNGDKPVSNRKQRGWPSPKEMEAKSVDELRDLSQEIAAAEGKDSMAYKQCVEIGKKKASAA